MNEQAEALRPRPADLRTLLSDLARMKAALESIAANTCCDRCQEAALVARLALRQHGDGR